MFHCLFARDKEANSSVKKSSRRLNAGSANLSSRYRDVSRYRDITQKPPTVHEIGVAPWSGPVSGGRRRPRVDEAVKCAYNKWQRNGIEYRCIRSLINIRTVSNRGLWAKHR